MRITEKAWAEYVSRLARLCERAGQEMAGYLEQHGTADAQAVAAYACALVQKYGAGSAELCCQMYDAAAALAGAAVPPAEPAAPAEYGEVAGMVHSVQGSGPLLQSGVKRFVKQAGADTTLQNALRDGAEFAWVPHGDTCAFCLTLASRGWQRASKKALKNGHAEHIHPNCDCEYAVRFDGKSGVAGYDPEEYLAQYNAAGGDINALRRAQYAKSRERINAQKRAAYAEQHRRRIGAQGQEIIDKPTYSRLTRTFLNDGGVIVRGEDAARHLEGQGAYASYVNGGKIAFIRDDATVSDVLEEMYHAEQDRKNMFSDCSYSEMMLRREIDAQRYLLSVAEKYKIPVEETETTRRNLVAYEARLEQILRDGAGDEK